MLQTVREVIADFASKQAKYRARQRKKRQETSVKVTELTKQLNELQSRQVPNPLCSGALPGNGLLLLAICRDGQVRNHVELSLMLQI